MTLTTDILIRVSTQLSGFDFRIETNDNDEPVLRLRNDTRIAISHTDLQLIEDCINRYQHQRK